MTNPSQKPSTPASGSTAKTDRDAPKPGDQRVQTSDESVAGEEDPGAALDIDMDDVATSPKPDAGAR